MITKPTERLPYIYRDVCTMIIAFIIALCLNKCKLQAYVLGNCYKKNPLKSNLGMRNCKSEVPIRNERTNFGRN